MAYHLYGHEEFGDVEVQRHVEACGHQYAGLPYPGDPDSLDYQLFVNFMGRAHEGHRHWEVHWFDLHAALRGHSTKYRDVSGPGRYGQTRSRHAGTLKNLDTDDFKAIRAESCMMERAAGLSTEVVARGGALYICWRSKLRMWRKFL